VHLADLAISCQPASRAAVATYESTNGHTAVTTQVSSFPACQGMRDRPLGHFLSEHLELAVPLRPRCLRRPWPGQSCHSRRDAWGLLTDEAMKAKCIDQSPTVALMWDTKGRTKPQADFDLYCFVVESQTMIRAWRKANPHYVAMKLPVKKPVPTACSSWT